MSKQLLDFYHSSHFFMSGYSIQRSTNLRDQFHRLLMRDSIKAKTRILNLKLKGNNTLLNHEHSTSCQPLGFIHHFIYHSKQYDCFLFYTSVTTSYICYI